MTGDVPRKSPVPMTPPIEIIAIYFIRMGRKFDLGKVTYMSRLELSFQTTLDFWFFTVYHLMPGLNSRGKVVLSSS